MRVIFSFFTLFLISYSSILLAVDCGHLDSAQCEFPNSDVDSPLDNDKYQHFGMIAKGFDGRLSITYREGQDHVSGDSKIVFVQSNDNGKTWNENLQILSKNSGPNLDYRDPNIGYSGNGTLILTYALQDESINRTFWKYRVSVDNGANWSDELDFRPYQQFDDTSLIPVLSDGLPYGRVVAIPGLGNRVIATGYHSRSGQYRLANWMGTIQTVDGITSMRWDEIAPTEATGASTEGTGVPYIYAEHSVLPLTENVWISASRGPDSITIFKTLDAGQSWNEVGRMPDDDGLSAGNVYHRLVAPMLDVLHIDGEMHVVLLYTQRPCETSTPDIGISPSACSVLRIGKGVQQFIENQIDHIVWSDRVGISSFIDDLSGYQSGVFLNNDISKYFHLEFHEKSSTDADLQTRLIDLRNIFSQVTFSQPELGSNLLTDSYFNNLNGLPQNLNGGSWFSLGNGWNVVPSGAKIGVKVDDNDAPGHPRHLQLDVEPGEGNTNAYLGINQTIENRYLELQNAGFGQVSFYAKTNVNKTLKTYFHLGTLDSSDNIDATIALENIIIGDTWQQYTRCFAIPGTVSGSSTTKVRFTIGYQDQLISDLENDLIIDNVLLRSSDSCQ